MGWAVCPDLPALCAAMAAGGGDGGVLAVGVPGVSVVCR